MSDDAREVALRDVNRFRKPVSFGNANPGSAWLSSASCVCPIDSSGIARIKRSIESARTSTSESDCDVATFK